MRVRERLSPRDRLLFGCAMLGELIVIEKPVETPVDGRTGEGFLGPVGEIYTVRPLVSRYSILHRLYWLWCLLLSVADAGRPFLRTRDRSIDARPWRLRSMWLRWR